MRLHLLQDMRTWILPPTLVSVEVSADGEAWSTFEVAHKMAVGDESVKRLALGVDLPEGTRARFVRVLAQRRHIRLATLARAGRGGCSPTRSSFADLYI